MPATPCALNVHGADLKACYEYGFKQHQARQLRDSLVSCIKYVWEGIDESIDHQGAKVLPEEDCAVPNLQMRTDSSQ